ncbi:MAG: Kelch repeat-containing protein [Marinilabiliaceae bacterium]
MTRRQTYPLKAVLLAALAVAAVSCEDEDNEILQGNWYNTYQYFPGTPRGGAVCFQLEYEGEKRAFIGTGANTNKTEDMERYRDFYMCSMGENGLPVWTARYAKLLNKNESAAGSINGKNEEGKKASEAVCSMPNTFSYADGDTVTKVYDCPARNGAVAFSLKIGGKPYGFVGLGYDGTNYLKDFWRYDPETNSWSRVADYPGDAVRYASAFVIGNRAYVGGGEDFDNNILGDFYAYDAESNKWVDGGAGQAMATCGVPRAQAAAFVCNGKGYLYGGINGNAIDILERYDPKTNSWEQMRRLSDASRDTYDDLYVGLAAYGTTAFVLNDGTDDCRAYVTTGGSVGSGKLTWEYNPKYDYWVPKTSFEGDPRKFAVSFVLDGTDGQEVGFVTTGSTSELTVSGSGGSFYADCFMWQPQAPYEHRD